MKIKRVHSASNSFPKDFPVVTGVSEVVRSRPKLYPISCDLGRTSVWRKTLKVKRVSGKSIRDPVIFAWPQKTQIKASQFVPFTLKLHTR